MIMITMNTSTAVLLHVMIPATTMITTMITIMIMITIIAYASQHAPIQLITTIMIMMTMTTDIITSTPPLRNDSELLHSYTSGAVPSIQYAYQDSYKTLASSP